MNRCRAEPQQTKTPALISATLRPDTILRISGARTDLSAPWRQHHGHKLDNTNVALVTKDRDSSLPEER